VTVLRPFVSVQEGLTLVRTRASSAGVLRRQLDSLVAATSGHSVLEAENHQLRELLRVREMAGPAWIPAGVVRSGTVGSESTFMLDIGSEDGVTRLSPVITVEGVVGRVQEVYPKSSIAVDWTHPEFSVSSRDPAGTTFGIVKSRRGQFREEDRLEFNGTAFTSRLEDGTVIVTNGLGGVFPPGIPVGKVDGLAEADAGWRKSYWLRPMVEVGAVSYVLVGVAPGTSTDLSGIWPSDSVLTGPEAAARDQAREDSLQALRTILSAPLPIRDSLLAAMLLGTPAPQPPPSTPAVPAAVETGPPAPGGADGRAAGTTGTASGGSTSGAPPVTSPRAGSENGVTPARAGQPPRTVPPDSLDRTRFPPPGDTVQMRARPDSNGLGRGRGGRPDTTRSSGEGGAYQR
jgi:cell shape-determining protein MreC